MAISQSQESWKRIRQRLSVSSALQPLKTQVYKSIREDKLEQTNFKLNNPKKINFLDDKAIPGVSNEAIKTKMHSINMSYKQEMKFKARNAMIMKIRRNCDMINT